MRSKWRLRAESDDFLHVDALRVIATLCVVLYHWRQYFAGLDPIWQNISDRLGIWASLVDLFFLISGIIITHVYVTRMSSLAAFADFMRKRLARLAPLHWATFAFFLAAGFVAPLIGHRFSNPEAYAANCIAPNVALLQSYGLCDSLTFNYPSWSISAELGCYVLFPLMVVLYRVKVWLPGLLGLATIAVLQALGPIWPNGAHWYELNYFFGTLRGLPAFALGVSLYGMRGKLRFRGAGRAMYAALVAYLLLGQFSLSRELSLLAAYALGVLAVAADSERKTGRFTRWLAPFGALTYPTYMLHMVVGASFISMLAISLLHWPAWAINVSVFAFMPVLVALAYLSYVLFETPARRWLSGRKSDKSGGVWTLISNPSADAARRQNQRAE